MRWWAWILVGALVVVHLVIDLFVPIALIPAGPGRWIPAVLLGLCVGQVNLIAAWASLAPGRVVVRLPWTALLAMLMWYAFILGNNGISSIAENLRVGGFARHTNWLLREDALLLGIVLLGGVTLAQIPLWGASRLFRWRLVPPGGKLSPSPDENRFNIVHLLLGMTIVAITLALARVVLPPGENRIARLGHELPVLLPAVIVCNLLTVLPCIWGAFVRLLYVVPVAVAWIVFAILVSLLEIAVLSAFLGSPPSEIYFTIPLFNLSQCLSVFGSLAILRAAGFQLIRWKREGGLAMNEADIASET